MKAKAFFGLSVGLCAMAVLVHSGAQMTGKNAVDSDLFPIAYDELAVLEPAAGEAMPIVAADNSGSSIAGAYLSSHYAQSRNDWRHANLLLEQILARDPENHDLIRQSMVLAAGSGQHDLAARRAQQIIVTNPQDALASLILATDAIARAAYDEAITVIASMPRGDMTDFVIPLLDGWAHAGKKNFRPDGLKGTTIHAWHGGLMALYLERDAADVTAFAETILAPSGLTTEEVERAADLMAVAGRHQDAQNIYKALQAQKGGSDILPQKIGMVEKKEDIRSVVPAFNIKSPAEGAALAVYDLARILYQEQSDVSARVFAQMALNMFPGLVDARILIASSNARSGQTDEALAQYGMIPGDHATYLDAQHASAELLFEAGRMEEAVALLRALYETHKNPDSMIRIGDLYRGKEDYKTALEVYNTVAATLPDPIPQEYWYLLYSRGMTYERLDMWDKAEADLEAALAFQPDHPYLLNYLAYGWVDQGEKLDESLKMLLRAAAMRPSDGYITDSLGWAYFKAGQFAESIPHLEAAVELLPYDPTINDHLGDAYWKVGRKVEARFQWERARNYAIDDPELNDKIAAKLTRGLSDTASGPGLSGERLATPSVPMAGPTGTPVAQ